MACTWIDQDTLWEVIMFIVLRIIFNCKIDLPLMYILQLAYRVCGSLTDIVVETHRRKHLAYIMADQGAIVNPESAKNLPKQVQLTSGSCIANIGGNHTQYVVFIRFHLMKHVILKSL